MADCYCFIRSAPCKVSMSSPSRSPAGMDWGTDKCQIPNFQRESASCRLL